MMVETADRHIVLADPHQQLLYHIRLHIVVAVRKEQILSPGRLDSRIPRRGYASVILMKYPDSRIFPGQLVTKRSGSVRGTVVHQNQLQILRRLRLQTLHTAQQRIPAFIYRYNHTYHISYS